MEVNYNIFWLEKIEKKGVIIMAEIKNVLFIWTVYPNEVMLKVYLESSSHSHDELFELAKKLGYIPEEDQPQDQGIQIEEQVISVGKNGEVETLKKEPVIFIGKKREIED